MRTEQEIFDELAALCVSQGFAHAIAFFCYRDNFVGYNEELKGEDFAKLFSDERLIRTEISTLIGLMARGVIDLTLPSEETLGHYITTAEFLLKELHEVMLQPMKRDFAASLKETESLSPFTSAEVLREAIFYGAESAYSFQYRDLAPRKYARDEQWLVKNKKFSAQQAKELISTLLKLQEEKSLINLKETKEKSPELRTFLPGFEFTQAEVVERSGQPTEIVAAVLDSFSFANDGNPTFVALNEFNATDLHP